MLAGSFANTRRRGGAFVTPSSIMLGGVWSVSCAVGSAPLDSSAGLTSRHPSRCCLLAGSLPLAVWLFLRTSRFGCAAWLLLCLAYPVTASPCCVLPWFAAVTSCSFLWDAQCDLVFFLTKFTCVSMKLFRGISSLAFSLSGRL